LHRSFSAALPTITGNNIGILVGTVVASVVVVVILLGVGIAIGAFVIKNRIYHHRNQQRKT